MGKNSKKEIADRIKTIAVHAVAKECSVTTAYVYGVVKGTYINGKSDDVKKAYNEKYTELQQILS
jgi:hypothetical protein